MTADDPLPPNLKLFDANWTQFRVENILVSGIVVREEELEALYESAVFPEDSINIVLLYCPDGEGGSRVEPARLKHKNIDYLAVGPSLSYHMESMDERGIAAASGSPEGLDYAEEGPHGFVVLDVDPKEKRVSGHFIPFAKRGLYTVTVDIGGAEDTEEIINRIGEAMDARRIPETALVRLVLTGTLDIESGLKNTTGSLTRFRLSAITSSLMTGPFSTLTGHAMKTTLRSAANSSARCWRMRPWRKRSASRSSGWACRRS